MPKTKITAHMVVKNDDRFVYYAIQSVLPYVDTFLITDTGSCDQTVALIQSIKSAKIIFRQTTCQSKSDVTAVRGAQLESTKTDWFWIVDGDEIYPQAVSKEVVALTQDPQKNIILVRRHDLLGDIYHAQDERVGEYRLFGYHGHLLTRLVRKSAFPNLAYRGDYPGEGFYTQNKSLRKQDPSQVAATQGYLYHTMYLKRSSLNTTTFNRGKYKIETGIKLETAPPEVFSLPRPSEVRDPLTPRSTSYELLAKLITPLKKIKRKILD
jgi:glycosyltransferase involved in cell wall biosynthesis